MNAHLSLCFGGFSSDLTNKTGGLLKRNKCFHTGTVKIDGHEVGAGAHYTIEIRMKIVSKEVDLLPL